MPGEKDEETFDDEPMEIPPLLHSIYEEGPFAKCSICEGLLLEGEVVYEIQKVWRGKETVFEYAVCQSCGLDLVKSYSKESMEKIREFFENRFQAHGNGDSCHFCGREAVPGVHDLSVLGMCLGKFLLAPPVVICEPCNESINERLSKKTKDTYGEFIETNFPGIPAEWEVPAAPIGF
ncbi:MAG: hypothetical protein ACYTFG_07560 [Planctomycetota bacterium]|jgi:uncharacterized protein with PIN domain